MLCYNVCPLYRCCQEFVNFDMMGVMKRTIAVVILFLFGWVSSERVLAQGAGATQRPNSSVTTTLEQVQTFIVDLGARIGLNLTGLIRHKSGTTNVPDLTRYAAWLTGAQPFFQPRQVQNTIQPFQTPQTATSQYCVTLSRTFQGDTKTKSDVSTVEKTAPIDWIPELSQNSEYLNAIFGKKKIGNLTFDRPSPTIESPDCGQSSAAGEDQQTTEVGVTDAVFGDASLVDRVVNVIGQALFAILSRFQAAATAQNTAMITKSVLLPHEDAWGCSSAGCTQNEAPNASSDTVATGGFTQAFLPSALQHIDASFGKAKESLTIGGLTVDLDTPYALTKKAEVAFDRTKCSLVPKDIQETLGLTREQCTALELIPDTSDWANNCPIDAIAQMGNTGGDGACKLCNTQAYTSSANFLTPQEKQALPNGIPPLMQKVLELAGATFNVPSSVLLGTMLEEGSFNHFPDWKWTDETVREYSNCTIKDPIPRCRALAISTTAKGPFGILDAWWQANQSFREAVLTVFPKRSKDTISECNFVDAAFAAARELSVDQSHYYVDQPPVNTPLPNQCGTQPVYLGRDRPGSCSAWSADRVALSRLQYAERYCNDTVTRTVNTFNALTCGK